MSNIPKMGHLTTPGWEWNNDPNWLKYIFFRGVGRKTTNQFEDLVQSGAPHSRDVAIGVFFVRVKRILCWGKFE